MNVCWMQQLKPLFELEQINDYGSKVLNNVDVVIPAGKHSAFSSLAKG